MRLCTKCSSGSSCTLSVAMALSACSCCRWPRPQPEDAVLWSYGADFPKMHGCCVHGCDHHIATAGGVPYHMYMYMIAVLPPLMARSTFHCDRHA